MYNTFSWSPYLMAYISFVIQTFVVASYIWFPKDHELPKQPIIAFGYRFWKNFFFSFYFIFGTIMLHSALLWCLGQWTYRDWSFQLPSVVLGVQYVFGTILKRATKLDIGYAITAILTIILMNHFYIPRPSRMIESSAVFIMTIVAFIVVYPFVKEMERILHKEKNPDPVFDLTKKLHRIFSRKFNVVFWLIAAAEEMLTFAGTSLFIW